MNLLRRISTPKLIAVLVLPVVAVLITAVAVAASRSGPKPPPRSLASALNRALHSKPVDDVTVKRGGGGHGVLSLCGSDSGQHHARAGHCAHLQYLASALFHSGSPEVVVTSRISYAPFVQWICMSIFQLFSTDEVIRCGVLAPAVL